MRTPWGISENIETVSCGLLFADTAGHGGINVRLDKNLRIPIWLQTETHAEQGLKGWYEEDCDWCIPVIVFSKEFSLWAEQNKMNHYIENAHKAFKEHFLPDLIKRKDCTTRLAAFCEKHAIDCSID